MRGENGDGIEHDALVALLQAHHGRCGSNLLKRWKFPEEYASIALYHENLADAEVLSRELLVIHFANILVKTLGYGHEHAEDIDVSNADSTRFLNLTEPTITHIATEVQKIMCNGPIS